MPKVAFALIILAGSLSCSVSESYDLVLTRSSENGSVVVEVHAGKPSPTWFGPHPIRIFVVVDGARRLAFEDRIANDGANLSEWNFPIRFEPSYALICIKGEEQNDVLHRVSLDNAGHERMDEGC